jgi:hypothetical protein
MTRVDLYFFALTPRASLGLGGAYKPLRGLLRRLVDRLRGDRIQKADPIAAGIHAGRLTGEPT